MPFRKLWNSIRGKSSPSTPPSVESTSSVTGPKSDATPAIPSVAQMPVAAQIPAATARPIAAKSIRGAASRDDKKLFRRIESMSIQSVLEVSVGDGLRSLAMLQTLTHKGHSTPIHFIAIDEFEMGGNALTLREFHKQLREYPAKVQLVPMSIDAGLDRVVRTYGQVDLVIWSQDEAPTPRQTEMLARLSKPTTILVTQENGRWSETLASAVTQKRAA
ncbi:MAG: hypothetical protein KDB00_03005 [Planctomycetales bacterium]|nr:hypothetical protein [Planctomycetales bacterium]